MVERPDHPSRIIPARATFFADSPYIVGAQAALGDTEAHHIRVLRLGVGDCVALRDGFGHTAEGTLVRITKSQAAVEIDSVEELSPPPQIHLLVPVADRDRMLWLAEKSTELGVASWRPVTWHRSKSVTPRGDGPTFRTKIQARMISAMLQSRSGWIPEIFPESPPSRALAASPDGTRIVLDQSGQTTMLSQPIVHPLTLAIGPEGGFTPEELTQLTEANFTPCILAPNILRFETAALAALAVAHSMHLDRRHPRTGGESENGASDPGSPPARG